jgi:hypothetical protein
VRFGVQFALIFSVKVASAQSHFVYLRVVYTGANVFSSQHIVSSFDSIFIDLTEDEPITIFVA